MSKRLSLQEACEIANLIAEENGYHRVKIVISRYTGAYELFGSKQKKFWFMKWTSFLKDSWVESPYLEDLIQGLVTEIEKRKSMVDPRSKVADELRQKYMDKLLDKELQK